ncbi:hypothetical protein [Bradymonas sediminis]|uniref:Uncharacterized protein n=1 Tax=Bradymonas sediminis TaxID=1548548 RepID=A0A2Z4FL50_9DELT|nr:hypothetical protein [Bradymonas sediminis]AWV89689.1 hypothetical protein DN745_10190 [Bradymonas sediminis]TDP76570.1 hypothetical protein DFR33_102202 [Bradymonas sediminis]
MHLSSLSIRLTSSTCLAALTLTLFAGCGDAEVDASAEEPARVEAADGDLKPRYEPSKTDFYRMPWPSDARLHPDGGVDLSDLPHASENFVAKYIDAVRAVRGYSNLPVIYIPFSQAQGLSADALPTPKETLKAEADVQLINLSEDACGERTPLEVVFDAEATRFIDAQTLKVAPMPGWVLAPATPYALVVKTSFGGPNLSTARPQAFADAFNGDGDDDTLNASFAPLRDCLPNAGLSADDIAVATVFHTQDPVADLRAMREVVWDETTPVKDHSGLVFDDSISNDKRHVYVGYAPFPIFQKGEPPYSTEGGLEFDDQGKPVIQRWENVPFIVTVPPNHPGPLKLLVWSSGTGAVLGNNVSRRHWLAALDNGFAIAEFVAQFHEFRGERTFDPTMDSFNFLNPVSGRTVFRQQAAETSYFIRFLSEKIANDPDLPSIETDRVFYGGHSQGALVGTLVAASEPRIDTYLFNGVSAYLTETILSRKDPFDIVALLGQLLKDKSELDRFHPIIHMAQLGADVVDTQNYAPHWAGWPAHPGGSNVFIINGQHDDTTSVLGMNALLTAGDIHPVNQAGWEIDPYGLRAIESYPTPVKANRAAFNGDALTAAAYLNPDTGHFTLSSDTDANDAAVNFLVSSAEGEAVIDY